MRTVGAAGAVGGADVEAVEAAVAGELSATEGVVGCGAGCGAMLLMEVTPEIAMKPLLQVFNNWLHDDGLKDRL